MRRLLAMLGLVVASLAAPAQAIQPQTTTSGFLYWQMGADSSGASTQSAAPSMYDATWRMPSYGFALSGRAIVPTWRNPDRETGLVGEGMHVKRLFASVEQGPFRIVAGKFEPRFGRAWVLSMGLFGADAAGGYALAERIGGGLWVTLPETGLGRARVALEIFTADVTPLSAPLTNKRTADPLSRPLRYSDGGVGNTARPDNALLSIDVKDFAGITGLSLLVGFGRQGAGADGGGSEYRMVASVLWQHDFDGVNLTAIAEVADLRRPLTEERYTFTTAGLKVAHGRWTASVMTTALAYTEATGSRGRDVTLALGAGRDLGTVLDGAASLEFGAKREWTSTGTRDVIGLGLGWLRTF